MPYVLGYGSLLNNSYQAVSYATLIPNCNFPVRRAFNAHCEYAFPNSGTLTPTPTPTPTKYAALGLEYVPYTLASRINGVVIEVTDEEFGKIIKRERGYRQVRLDASYFTGLPSSVLADISVFIPETPEHPTEEYALNRNYIDICIEGFMRCNRQYAIDFLQTTSGWSPDMLEYALGRLQ